jgi:uncharacterized protein
MLDDLHSIELAFAQYIRAPNPSTTPAGLDNERMAIYRDLFYNNIESFLRKAFPVLYDLLPQAFWHSLVRDFFHLQRMHSPLFQEIPAEFVVFLSQHQLLTDYPFLYQLAHYEWAELALDIATIELPNTKLMELTTGITQLLTISPLAWLLHYDYPVHRISRSFIPTAKDKQATYLLVFRNYADTIEFHELDLTSARLLSLLKQPHTLASVLTQLRNELALQNMHDLLVQAQQLLSAWYQQGIIVLTEEDAYAKQAALPAQ